MVQLARAVTTTRLTLRRFEPDDLDDLSRLLGDEGVNRYLYWEPRDRDETREALRRRLDEPNEVSATGEENLLHVAVEIRESGSLVGSFVLRWIDNEHRQGEVGGSLHPDVHGRGLAPEVYEALLTLGFDQYHLHRIVGRTDARNVASVRALEKAGLHQEALLVENEFVKGEWTDEIVMALRADQWRDRVQQIP